MTHAEAIDLVSEMVNDAVTGLAASRDCEARLTLKASKLGAEALEVSQRIERACDTAETRLSHDKRNPPSPFCPLTANRPRNAPKEPSAKATGQRSNWLTRLARNRFAVSGASMASASAPLDIARNNVLGPGAMRIGRRSSASDCCRRCRKTPRAPIQLRWPADYSKKLDRTPTTCRSGSALREPCCAGWKQWRKQQRRRTSYGLSHRLPTLQ
jgi:hypothetical protein